MNSEAITRKYYSKLKSLPDIKVLSGIATVESFMVILRSIEIGLTYLFSFLLYVLMLIFLFITDRKLIFFFTDITSFFYLVMSLTQYYFFALTLFSPLVGYTFLPKYNEIKSSIVVFVASLLPLAFFIYRFPSLIIYSILVTTIFYIYIRLINKKGEKITGLKSLYILRPFLTNVVKKDPKPLERFLEEISVKSIVHVGIVKMKNLFLVIPKIHFGISGEVGSSKFIYQLENENKNNIVFHGPGSHEIDIASSTYSLKVAKIVAKEEEDLNNWEKLKFFGITRWNCGKFQGLTLNFDKISISFIERPYAGIDDLPVKLWNFTQSSGNYIVDCHNEYLKEEIPSNAYSCIVNGINKARKTDTERPLLLGYEEDNVNSCEGLCNNKVRVVYLSDGENDAALIYIYANNADSDLTKKIRETIGKIVKYPILITPDDHSCTGTAFGDLYLPAQPCEELVEKAYEMTLKAKNNAKEIDTYYKKVEIKGVKVLGSFISTMVNALEEVGSFALKTFWIPLISPFILTLIFVLLTNIHVKF